MPEIYFIKHFTTRIIVRNLECNFFFFIKFNIFFYILDTVNKRLFDFFFGEVHMHVYVWRYNE